jgi:hypothetical protein
LENLLQTSDFVLLLPFFSSFPFCRWKRKKKEDKNAMRNGAKLERAHIL